MWLWTVRTPHKRPRATMELLGGNRAYVPFFAKTAKLWGANAFFIETHPNPDEGLSDGPNMLKLSDLEALIKDLL